jgi:hypothetical protein
LARGMERPKMATADGQTAASAVEKTAARGFGRRRGPAAGGVDLQPAADLQPDASSVRMRATD